MTGRWQLPTQDEWRTERRDIIRGMSGGFLFGIPLMYTMEVWWIGSYTRPPLMLGVLGVTFVTIVLLNQTDGFRKNAPSNFLQALMDSIEALALGTICAALILILLREITLNTPLDEALGKVIFEAVPFSIGVALARTMLSSADEQDEQDHRETDAEARSSPQLVRQANCRATIADIGATLIGSIIVAFNVAPTDEVPMLAAASSPPWLLGIIAASLIISYGIVFMAGFTTQQKRFQQEGLIQRPVVETVTSYLLSLMAAALMLWFFHRLSLADPWTMWLQYALILGLPATIGGAAGRLAV